MKVEEAVYRLTGKTALMHDITDRGFLAAGKVADITIFDPDTIASKPREPVADLPGGGVQVKRDSVGIAPKPAHSRKTSPLTPPADRSSAGGAFIVGGKTARPGRDVIARHLTRSE